MHFLRIILFLLFLGSITTVFGQDDAPARRKGSRIIDDTTKQVYGPKTSKYFFEKDVFYNQEILHRIDTVIHNYHRWNFVQRYNNLYQDLGNVGTSARPIFYQTPDLIGATPGFGSFDLYWDSEELRYFDTKSPFSSVKIVLGGLGRSLTQVAFSRNISPRWNFGFNYRTLLIDKQIQRTGKGDRNVKSTYYDVYSTYKSKDSTYRLFVNFRRHHYQADEYGGVVAEVDKTDSANFLFDKARARPNLHNAESGERRISMHIFQQYQVFGKGFQVYHALDYYQQNNYFNDQQETYTFDFTNTDVGGDTVRDATKFHSFRNEVGLKGNLAKLFYNGYYAIRSYDMKYKYYNPIDFDGIKVSGIENYLGGRMSLFLDSIGQVNAWAEVEALGNFRIEGNIKSDWFEGSIKQMQYAPGFITKAYVGGHDSWKNNLGSVKATQINGYLHYKSKIFTLSPGFTFTRLNNYVFFQKQVNSGLPQTVLPVQSSGTQVIASPEVKLSLTMLRHVTLSGQGIYTSILQNDDQAIALPELFINGQLAYSNIFFHGNMDMQVGGDVHWKSSYYAMGYDPVIQQFYRQDTYLVPSFPIIDVFFNMKVKSGRIFVKYNNLMQAFTRSGYLPTPYYPGQRSALDFGFNLLFYN